MLGHLGVAEIQDGYVDHGQIIVALEDFWQFVGRSNNYLYVLSAAE